MLKIQEFLDIYKGSTRATYSSAINKFVLCIYDVKLKGRRSTKEEKAKLIKLANKYIDDSKRNHYDDLMQFASSLNESPPKTAKTYMAAVVEFLSHNGIELTKRELKTVHLKMPKGNGARTVEMDMEKDTIRQILEHMDLKGTALILTLASSGMRIGEALQIELEDINIESIPCSVTIRGEYTKSGEQRTTYISKEAKTTLIEWLKVREQYIKSSINRNSGFVKKGFGNKKDINDNRVFPFSDAVVYQMLENALSKSGLLSVDRVTGRKQLRIHQLRKFFRSQLAIGCPIDIVEALMGHEGYLTEAYRRYTKKQMSEEYLKHEHLLYISVPKDIQKIESEFKTELNTSRKILEQLIVEKNELNDQVKAIKEENTILKNQVESIASININEKIEDAMEDFIIDNTILKDRIDDLEKIIKDHSN